MTDLSDHFRPEFVEALERFVDERIALALDPEPVLDRDGKREPGDGEPVIEDDEPEPMIE